MKNIKKDFGLNQIHINMGMFDFTVVVVAGEYKKLEKYIQWKFDDKDFNLATFDQGYESRGKCIYSKGYCPVIWIPRKPRLAREHATLAHECIHAVWHLFDWAGIPITRDTEEVMTHSVAHLVNSILVSKEL